MSKEITPVEERIGQPSSPRLKTTAAVGDMIGQYRVDDLIGDGGMGTVYRCTDLTMKRTVAVKVLHPHLVETSKWYLRFAMEAEAIGRLEHPGIIKIHQFSPTDPPYIVMDFVQGKSLADVLASSGSLPYKRVLKIAVQIADALAHAHGKGVVHRDLKPSNVIILQGTDDVVQILDFGIAKLDGQDLDAIKLTQTGEVFGSPAYMSPEQVHGRKIGPIADQYSLGCLLFECLTGSPPFVGENPVEVMMQHVSGKPASLQEASLGTTFPRELERIVQVMLNKAPDQRFSSMQEAANALRGVENPEFRSAPAKKETPKRKPLDPGLLALAAIAVLTVVGVAAFFFVSINQKDAPDVVKLEAKSAATQPNAQDAKSDWTSNSTVQQVNAASTEEKNDIANADAIFKKTLEDWGQRSKKYLDTHPLAVPKGIDDDSFQFLDRAPLLKMLYIGETLYLTDKCLAYLPKLLPDLDTLTANFGVKSEGIESIAKLTHLTNLELQYATVSDEDLKKLDSVPNLTVFCFNHASGRFTGEGLAHFFNAHKKLRYIFLKDIPLHGAVPELAKLPIEALEVNFDEQLGDLTIQDLDALSHIQTIKDIRSDTIGAQGLKALMTMNNLKKLSVRTFSRGEDDIASALLRLKTQRPDLKVIVGKDRN